jgi:hypothetical protein
LTIAGSLIGVTGHADAAEAGDLFDRQADQFASTHAGHNQVREQDGYVRIPGQDIEGDDAIGGNQYPITMIAQKRREGFAEGVLVLDYKDQAASVMGRPMDWSIRHGGSFQTARQVDDEGCALAR